MKKVMKNVYMTIGVGAVIVFAASIECIVTSKFYIPIIALIIAVLSFIASIPFFSKRDIEILNSDNETEEVGVYGNV